jgi:hypothetical protein
LNILSFAIEKAQRKKGKNVQSEIQYQVMYILRIPMFL